MIVIVRVNGTEGVYTEKIKWYHKYHEDSTGTDTKNKTAYFCP